MATSQQDTEITLGTGRMLVLFFTFVLVCAVFFAIGFSLGRKTSMAGVGNLANPSAGAPAAIVRPSASAQAQQKPAVQPADFSFYKAVGSNSTTDAEPPSTAQAAAPVSQIQQPQAPTSTTTSAASTAPSGTAATGGYFVQVAAVTRQEDAQSLVEALKKKQYPAFTLNNFATDKFYHVQVGPYDVLKDAEAMRARLIADGYNPILKK